MARLGHIQEVENKDRVFGAAEKYMALNVEDEDGGNERWLLFTPKGWSSMKTVAADSLPGLMKEGRLYKYGKGFVCAVDGNIMRFTQKQLDAAQLRAEGNKEDLPRKSFLRDLLD